MLDAKAKELADMIGEVSIKTVDNSEFDEGSIRNKQEVEEEGYMGGKVCHSSLQYTLSCLSCPWPLLFKLCISCRADGRLQLYPDLTLHDMTCGVAFRTRSKKRAS